MYIYIYIYIYIYDISSLRVKRGPSELFNSHFTISHLQLCVSVNVYVMLRISARPYRQHPCQRSDYLVNTDFNIHCAGTRDDGMAVPKYIASSMFMLPHNLPE